LVTLIAYRHVGLRRTLCIARMSRGLPGAIETMLASRAKRWISERARCSRRTSSQEKAAAVHDYERRIADLDKALRASAPPEIDRFLEQLEERHAAVLRDGVRMRTVRTVVDMTSGERNSVVVDNYDGLAAVVNRIAEVRALAEELATMPSRSWAHATSKNGLSIRGDRRGRNCAGT
jgi:hypothetical protein